MNLTAYLGIGALIAMMGLGLWGYHYKVEARDALVMRDAAVRDKDTAVAANKATEVALAKIAADKLASDKLATELQDKLDAANQVTLDLANNLSDLRAHNAAVNDYLNGLIPADLLRLYDQPETIGSH